MQSFWKIKRCETYTKSLLEGILKKNENMNIKVKRRNSTASVTRFVFAPQSKQIDNRKNLAAEVLVLWFYRLELELELSPIPLQTLLALNNISIVLFVIYAFLRRKISKLALEKAREIRNRSFPDDSNRSNLIHLKYILESI